MAIDFPNTPTVADTHSVGTRTWVWDGSTWNLVSQVSFIDGMIVNGDISASAAIALSKLASGTSGQIVVVNGSGVPTYVALSGDATISNAGVITNAWDQDGNVLVNQVFS